MLKIALDSNVLVHYVSRAAKEHPVTKATYQRYRSQGAEFVVAEHSILEAFSVLTRTHRPVGIDPKDALEALGRNFGDATIAPIRKGLAWESIRHTMARGHWGGRVYDTIIALAVHDAGASVLLTWNLRHFVTIAPPGLEIREPL
jgi:predicted nucleic acid-binding protein